MTFPGTPKMRRFIPVWLCVAVLAFAAAPALAAPLLLSPSDYNPKALLPPPPPEGSEAAKAELAELDRIQSQRTAEDFARADHDFHARDASLFAAVIGPAFDLTKLPVTARLLESVHTEENTAATVAKDYFRRTRPWIVDPALNSCSKDDAPQSSYPSGHSAMGYSLGVVLAALIPEKAPAIMARAADFAENRLVCGMHRRRDIQSGQVLGTVVAELLLRKPRFHREFEAARSELRAAAIIP
jgi:acid phosphatase (class A)